MRALARRILILRMSQIIYSSTIRVSRLYSYQLMVKKWIRLSLMVVL
jgi:hypothetical protein